MCSGKGLGVDLGEGVRYIWFKVDKSKQSSRKEFKLLPVISISIASEVTYYFSPTASEARLVEAFDTTPSGTPEALASDEPSAVFNPTIALAD